MKMDEAQIEALKSSAHDCWPDSVAGENVLHFS